MAKFDHMNHNPPGGIRPDVLSVKEAADELGMSRRGVLHRIATGAIAATKIGDFTAAYVIARAEIERVKAAEVDKAAS